jgi:hypothetical protein
MKALAWMSKHVKARPEPARAARCRLVVQESGSTFLPADLGGADWDETIVLPADDSSVPVKLAVEVAGRVAAMERHKAVLGCAALVVSTANEPQTAPARELVARALLSHLVAGGAGELVLVAPGASSVLRDQMLSLVGRLLEELESRAVTIRVHFHESQPEAPLKSEVRLARPEGSSRLASRFATP